MLAARNLWRDGSSFTCNLNADSALLGSWMLCNALPELTKDGTVEQVVSAITDISHLKWAETVNVNRVEEANESKKHALAFIDMTSHEVYSSLRHLMYSNIADYIRFEIR